MVSTVLASLSVPVAAVLMALWGYSQRPKNTIVKFSVATIALVGLHMGFRMIDPELERAFDFCGYGVVISGFAFGYGQRVWKDGPDGNPGLLIKLAGLSLGLSCLVVFYTFCIIRWMAE